MKKLLSIYCILLICCQANAEDAVAHPTNRSAYSNDPFKIPRKITPLSLPDSWPINIHRDPVDRSPTGTKTILVTLGTGMPSPNPYRSGPSHAVIVDGRPYLIDAGEGIWRAISKSVLINGDKLSRALSPEKINTLFITHLHQDHTIGLPSLILNPLNWIFEIKHEIFGPAGTEDMLNHIISAWQTDTEAAIQDGYDPNASGVTAYDILFEDRGIVYEDSRVRVEAFRTKHASLEYSFAYRFITSDRVIVFTGDGGPYHENIVLAAKDADILVTETVTERNIRFAPWGGDTIEEKKKEIFRFHFSPQVLARIAKEANVGKIVLTHEQNYSKAEAYDPLGLAKEVRAAGYEGEIFSAMDGDIY